MGKEKRNSLVLVESRGGMASPWDRLGAFIVDIVFLFPFVQILQAPWRRGIDTASVLENEGDLIFLKGAIVTTFVITFFCYQVFCHYYFHKTLGKKVMGLQLIFRQGTPSFYSVCLRSLTLYFEILMMGVPLLGVFTHFRRRVLHDKASDTFVVSLKNVAMAPLVHEKNRGLIAAGLMSVFFLGFVFSKPPETVTPMLVSVAAEESEECEIFKEASDGGIESALQAYASQSISDDCLRGLSKEALWKEESPILANLGMAFAEAKSSDERSKAYKDEVCSLDLRSTACQFVEWTNEEPLSGDVHWEKIVSIIEKPGVPDFYRLFFVVALQKHHQYGNALEVIRSLRNPEAFAEEITEATFKSLMWENEWDAAYWLFKINNISSDILVSFIQEASDTKAFPPGKIVKLMESFYPHLNVSPEQQRRVASEQEAPAALKMLWIRLQRHR